MLNTLKYVALSLVRDKGIMIWALAFPIVLSTCFMFMFAALDTQGAIKAIPVAVVTDSNWEKAEAFQSFMEATSESEDASSGDSADKGENADKNENASDSESTREGKGAGEDDNDNAMFDVVEVANATEATDLVRETASDESPVVGYITVDESGLPETHVKNVTSDASMETVDIAILVMAMDAFTSKSQLAADVLSKNPAAFGDPGFASSLFELEDLTDRVAVTQNAPKESVRYYFALMGMAAMFGAQAALIATLKLLPNMGPLGARREIGATSHVKALTGTMLASWLVSFSCLLVAYAYIRLVVGIDFAGRDVGCILAIAASSLMATSLGACLGSLPKLNNGAKTGILTALVCFCALFAGLYGQPTMELADSVAQSAPWSVVINPAAQISETFFSLMYYSTPLPMLGHVAILMVMTLVLFAISALFLRRQRYASL